MRKKIHRYFLEVLYFANALSLLYWLAWLDSIISWQPYAIMAVNATILIIGAYANGLINTTPYDEREEW